MPLIDQLIESMKTQECTSLVLENYQFPVMYRTDGSPVALKDRYTPAVIRRILEEILPEAYRPAYASGEAFRFQHTDGNTPVDIEVSQVEGSVHVQIELVNPFSPAPGAQPVMEDSGTPPSVIPAVAMPTRDEGAQSRAGSTPLSSSDVHRRLDLPTKIPHRLKWREGRLRRLGGFLGIVLGVATSILVGQMASHQSMLGRMFDLHRLETVIPMAISSMFFWAIIVCGFRWFRLRALERISRRDQLLRMTQAIQSSQDVEESAHALKGEACQASPLLRRLHAALQQWTIRASLQDADLVLQHHVLNDEETIHTGYSLVRTFVWALPVLGLIGTVLGISDAVGGFAQFLGGDINDVAVIKKNLVGVTGGLSFAFLITLHGLLTSLVTMLAASSLQTREEKFYATIQQWIAETFLPRLQEAAPESKGEADTAVITVWSAALQQTTASVLSTIREATARLLGEIETRQETLGRQAEEGLVAWRDALQQAANLVLSTVRDAGTKLITDMEANQQAQDQRMSRALTAWDESVRCTGDSIFSTLREAGTRMLREIDARQETHRQQITEWTEGWQQNMQSAAARLEGTLNSVGGDLVRASHDVLEHLLGLQGALQEAQALMAAQAQVSTQQHAETLTTMAEQIRVVQMTSDTLAALGDTTRTALQQQSTLQEAMRQLSEANIGQMLAHFVEAIAGQTHEVQTVAEAVQQLTARTAEVLSSQTALQEAMGQLRETDLEQSLAAFHDSVEALATQVREVQVVAEAVRQLTARTGDILGAQTTLQEAVSQLREMNFLETLAGFRNSLVALGPILQDFRKPFVWQAVPVSGNQSPAE